MKQARALTITGGRLVTPTGVRPGSLRCVDGTIAAMRPSTQRTAPGTTPPGSTSRPPVIVKGRSNFMPSPRHRARAA